MFTDQLVDVETQTIFDWNYIKTVKGSSRKGPTPLWYKTVQISICRKNSSKFNQTQANKQWIKFHPNIYDEISKDK